MIKNDRQYRLTRAQVDRFKSALTNLAVSDDVDPLRHQLETAALEGELAELEQQLGDYDALRRGDVELNPPAQLDLLPIFLIQQRIAKQMTQRALAERLGLKEQQIQRYEADDWRSASLHRLIEVARALDVPLPVDAPPAQERDIMRALSDRGIDRTFVRRRLHAMAADGTTDVVDLAAKVARVYGWPEASVLSGKVPSLPELAEAASFKFPKRRHSVKTNAYIAYSHYLAMLSLDTTTGLAPLPVPTEAKEFRSYVLDRHGSVGFESVLDAVWDLGIPVLPLADPGAFHAVLWRSGGRNVIVLKQQHRSPSRWAFDVLHELRHGAEAPSEATHQVVEDDGQPDDGAEQIANSFAGDVLLDGRAEEITAIVVKRSSGAVEALKRVVPVVAQENGVATADLANYVAFRLSLQNIDWWGTAAVLQDTGFDPYQVARRRFLASSDLRRLAPLDLDIFLQALTERT